MILPLALILAAAPLASQPSGGARQERITRDGTPWVASTWGYSTPKLLFDGKRLFAVALVGSGIHHDVARLYWRDVDDAAGEWKRGVDLSPVYQPATILLDDQGFVHVFSTELGVRGFHWRSRRAGEVSAFDPV